MSNKVTIFLWGIVALFLLLYSYTQVDLSLTLTSDSIAANIQRSFQYIGWFRRDLSTYLYIGIITFLSILFLWTMTKVSKNEISEKSIKLVILGIAGILTLSYAAFSYDIFNYIFDAKIVTHYHLNPYLQKALDFPQDPMLSFMRSTHRVYPYGPSWLLLTVPISFIGANFFIVTFFLFKALSSLSYLAACYYLYAIAKKLDLKNPLLAVSLFAFNPLVIIEGLVSAHNEIVMMALVLFAVHLLLSGRKTVSLLTYLVSVGIKYTTIFLAPIFIISLFTKKYLKPNKFIPISVILMTLAVVATSVASGQNKNPEFQPWYLLSLAPFVALYENKIARALFISVSIVVLLSYIPFLLTGSWPEDIVMQKNILLLTGGIIGVSIGLLVTKSIKK